MGYKNVSKVNDPEGVKNKFRDMLNKNGPSFLHVKVGEAPILKTGRVSIEPEALSRRIMDKVAEQKI